MDFVPRPEPRVVGYVLPATVRAVDTPTRTEGCAQSRVPDVVESMVKTIATMYTEPDVSAMFHIDFYVCRPMPPAKDGVAV